MSGEIPIVQLDGELDMVRAPGLRLELMGAVDNRHAGLVVDLTGATYLDSAAVNVLFEVADELRQHQLEMALVIPPDSLVQKVVMLVDLGSVAPIQADVEAALAHVDGSG
jgi:anti-sigma B factor antagonist